jgi:hypothetical protein
MFFMFSCLFVCLSVCMYIVQAGLDLPIPHFSLPCAGITSVHYHTHCHSCFLRSTGGYTFLARTAQLWYCILLSASYLGSHELDMPYD